MFPIYILPQSTFYVSNLRFFVSNLITMFPMYFFFVSNLHCFQFMFPINVSNLHISVKWGQMRSNIRTKVCFVRMAGLFLYRGRSGLNNRRVFILFYIIYYIIYLAWFRRILLERIPRIFKQKPLLG